MVDYQSPSRHPAFEEYCETIFELDEDSVDVIQARIAERLGVSRPAVSEMIKRMETAGMLTTDPKIALSPEGQQLAETVVRRHRIAERFLTDVLGLSWAATHEEAGKWEHVISAEVEEAMVAKLDFPTTCPHGNPIPKSGYVPTPMVALSSLQPGDSFVVERVPATLEFYSGMLEYLELHSVTPGNEGTVQDMSPDGAAMVMMASETIIDHFACSRIMVAVN